MFWVSSAGMVADLRSRKALLPLAIAPLVAAASPDSQPPRLDVQLTPTATTLNVRMSIGGAPFKAGDPLVELPLVMVGIPTARYDGDALQAHDSRGAVPLTHHELPPTPQGTVRQWAVQRDTVGPVVVTVAAAPHAVSAATNNGPLFDLRREGTGYMGAGVGFMPVPTRTLPYRLHLHWRLPRGWRGVWSLGEGDVDTVAPPAMLANSFYGTGPIQSYPAGQDPKFGLYWISPPPFDAAKLGRYVQTVYARMAEFFGDPVTEYRVFVRQNPYAGVGGTALYQSFMFGYQPSEKPTLESLQGTLSHEITHNWPSLQGEHGETAWYSEGTAEYYSLLVPYRAGLLSLDQLTDMLNNKARKYYRNRFRTLSNPEVAKLFWSDPVAQRVPYGRGFVYLARTDAAIRARSGGKRSLDDVVLALRKREKSDQSYGIADWLSLVGAELGADVAKRDYDAMVAGTLMTLPADRFAPCLTVVRDDAPAAAGSGEGWKWQKDPAATGRCPF